MMVLKAVRKRLVNADKTASEWQRDPARRGHVPATVFIILDSSFLRGGFLPVTLSREIWLRPFISLE